MADLFTHVLAAFVVFTLVGWAVEWLDRKWVAVAMVGTIFPDLSRISLVVDADAVEALLGVPFSWDMTSTLGGLLVISAIGAVLFGTARNRRVAFPLLLGGGLTHLFLDGLVAWADGHGEAALYPLTYWRLPTPGLYVSSDPRVLVTAVVCALVVFAADRYIVSS